MQNRQFLADSKILVVIIARGGSKGIPNKNLADIGGKPMISHCIETALKASELIPLNVIVSTDSCAIRKVSLIAGAWVPFIRPAHLAGDNIQSCPVVQHAVSIAESIVNHRYETIVYSQATSPLASYADMVKCIEVLKSNSEIESVVAVVETETHPFRMKRMLSDRRIVNYIDQGFEDMRPRQSLPKVYRRAGSFYVSRRRVVMEDGSLVGDPCIGIPVSPETAVDIDSQIDLELVRLLYNNFKSSKSA
jgi:CMP-N,N'-diacetyllegionaminic acid synthase